MNKIVKLLGLFLIGYGAFSAGRAYEVGHLVIKGLKFISNLPVPEEEEEENDISKEPKKVTIRLSKEEYDHLKDILERNN